MIDWQPAGEWFEPNVRLRDHKVRFHWYVRPKTHRPHKIQSEAERSDEMSVHYVDMETIYVRADLLESSTDVEQVSRPQRSVGLHLDAPGLPRRPAGHRSAQGGKQPRLAIRCCTPGG